MNPHPVFTRLILVGAAMAITTGTAGAVGIDFEGGGSFTEVPLYRAYVFTGLDRDNDGAYAFDDIDGRDYISNTAPKPLATAGWTLPPPPKPAAAGSTCSMAASTITRSARGHWRT